MDSAQQWATNYFLRLDRMVEQLRSHELIDKVVYIKFKGLSDEELRKVEEDVAERLNFLAEEIHHLDVPNMERFPFNEYMVQFYKISNGLHLSWNSHMMPSPIEESSTLVQASAEQLVVPKDKHDACEGWVSILPLSEILNRGKFGIYGDPQDSSYGQAVAQNGGYLTYIDYYHFYYDACIALDRTGNPSVVFGTNNSAKYDNSLPCDFVIYMEYLLATFGSVLLRSSGLKNLNQAKTDQTLAAMVRENKYEGVQDWMNQYAQTDLDQLLRQHFNEKSNYASIEHFQSKPEAIYNRIESLLEIDIEEEFGY